jgi:hypothetical protein
VELLSEMLSLAETFMIVRWMSSLLSIRNCKLSQFKWGAQINCGGFPPKKEYLRSKISLEPCHCGR